MARYGHYPRFITALYAALILFSCTAKPVAINPPVAPVVPQILKYGNNQLSDPYFWMRNRKAPQIGHYLRAENAYTEAKMKHTETLQKKLYAEMVSRVKEEDNSVPEKIDDYYYYDRTEAGKEYTIHCRKKGSLQAPEEIILDENELAAGHSYFDLGVFEVSPDHRLLAFAVDVNGAETFTLQVKDLATGKVLPDRVPNTYYGTVWANDNKTLFYNVLDGAKRPYKILRHALGTPVSADKLIYEEKDRMFHVYPGKTKSEQYILIETSSNTTSEVHVLSADHPQMEFEIIAKRRPGIEYSIFHHVDKFFILTNEKAVNFKLMETTVLDPGRENWKEVIPAREDVSLDGVDVFKNFLVVVERVKGLRKLRIQNLASNKVHYVPFTEPVYTFYRDGNSEFNTDILRYDYQSLVTPPTVYDYNMSSRESELKKRFEIPNYDLSKYTMERIYAPGAGGVMIPISLVYRKGLVRDSSNPVWLTGYGSYGSTREPYFNSDRFSMIDRGFIYAIAHIRGGGDLGRKWYDEGKLLKKVNTFNDFISCAEHLIKTGYTSTKKISITGGSAGGLLMGAVTNMRPDLFRTVIAYVPYVDVIHTMMDPTIPLTVTEYEEWGNPNRPEFYEYMKAYSPYDNVKPQEYPAMLITVSWYDPRVPYWEGTKWAAKLRATKTDNNLLLLKANLLAGHSGVSGRYSDMKDLAFDFAFMLDQHGIVN